MPSFIPPFYYSANLAIAPQIGTEQLAELFQYTISHSLQKEDLGYVQEFLISDDEEEEQRTKEGREIRQGAERGNDATAAAA